MSEKKSPAQFVSEHLDKSEIEAWLKDHLHGLEHLEKGDIEAWLKDLHKDDGPEHYDKDWLKQENDRRRAHGLPPLQERKRKALDRERLRTVSQMVPPGVH
jgi:hypothetical protein